MIIIYEMFHESLCELIFDIPVDFPYQNLKQHVITCNAMHPDSVFLKPLSGTP